MPPRQDKEQQAKDAADRARVEKQRQAGNAALNQASADDAAKSDEQRAAEEAEALAQAATAAAEEKARVEAEQEAAAAELERIEAEARAEAQRLAAERAAEQEPDADELNEQLLIEKLAELSADARLLKAGTIVHLNGEPCTLPVDFPVVIAHGADEQTFAAVLARNPANFALNAVRLRLVYNQMNGSPLPLSSQRLSLEEMTDQERAIFEVPASRPKK